MLNQVGGAEGWGRCKLASWMWFDRLVKESLVFPAEGSTASRTPSTFSNCERQETRPNLGPIWQPFALQNSLWGQSRNLQNHVAAGTSWPDITKPQEKSEWQGLLEKVLIHKNTFVVSETTQNQKISRGQEVAWVTEVLQEGGPLPRPGSGLLFDTRKWILWETKRLYWEGAPRQRTAG